MKDETFDALRNENRRELLLGLLESNPQNLTQQIPVIWNKSPADADQQFQTAVRHLHLPTLEAYGFIRWDEDDHEIVKEPQYNDHRQLLECICGNIARFRDTDRPSDSPYPIGGRN